MAEEKQTSLKPLTIYFYHTRLTRESYEEWKEYKFPGHILYGLPLLEKHGIRSVMHKCRYFSSRLRLMLYATKEILFCKEKYQVLYATSFRGIEPVIFLRALGAIPQADRYLAPHGSSQQFRFRTRTNIPPFL